MKAKIVPNAQVKITLYCVDLFNIVVIVLTHKMVLTVV